MKLKGVDEAMPPAIARPNAAPRRKQLEQAALADDPEVLALARELLERLGPPPAPAIEIGRGAKGIIGQTVIGATIVGDLH